VKALPVLWEGLGDFWPADPGAARCDGRGRVLDCTSLAQLGPLGEAARAVTAQRRFRYDPGDTVLLNDPFSGGTRVQDLICLRRTDVGVAAVRTTVPDFGGDRFGGYNPHAVEVWAEGNRLTPIRIARDGELIRDSFTCALLNSRTPRIFEQVLRSLLNAAEELAAEAFEDRTEAAAAAARSALASFRGRRSGWVWAEIAGTEPAAVVVASASYDGERMILDFERSSPQLPRYVNATRGVTISAALAALPDAASLPANDGLLDVIEVRTRPGTVVHASYPAPTARGPHLTAYAVTSAVSTLLRTPLSVEPSIRLLDADGFLDATIAAQVQLAEAAAG
jgi:N-methylhydantoinase B